MKLAFLAILAAAPLPGGCFGDDRGHQPDGGHGTDAPPGTPDARIDGRPGEADARPGADHLLLSEIRTMGLDEFIEIVNPTASAVSLNDYYLTDIPGYWQLPGHVAGNTVLSSGPADFMVKFPTGASIAPGEVIVVAVNGPDYATSFGTPDYTIVSSTAGATPMTASPVPNGFSVTLTNDGEVVILFAWDGARDRVADVDIVIAGNAPDPGNMIGAKSAVDGPDGDTTTTAYAAEAMSIQDMQSDCDDVGGVKRTYKRRAAEDGMEVNSGGNGITGHDETSEQLRTTWDSNASPGGYTVATPGVAPTF